MRMRMKLVAELVIVGGIVVFAAAEDFEQGFGGDGGDEGFGLVGVAAGADRGAVFSFRGWVVSMCVQCSCVYGTRRGETRNGV